jgi:hypothetical protein
MIEAPLDTARKDHPAGRGYGRARPLDREILEAAAVPGARAPMRTHTKAIYRKVGAGHNDTIAIAGTQGILQFPVSLIPTAEQKGFG